MSDKEADVARNYDKSGPKGMSVSDGQDGSNDFPKTYRIPKRKRESKYDYNDESEIDEDDSDNDFSDPYAESSEYDSDNEQRRNASHDVEKVPEVSDEERFDPLDSSDEFILRGSMERYVQKYFNTYVSDERAKIKILENAPVPENDFLNPPQVNEYIEDLFSN